MKPKTLGLVAALVVLPTVVAVVPGGLATGVTTSKATTYRATAPRATTSRATTSSPARSWTSPRPSVKGGTPTLVSVIVTTGTDAPPADRDPAHRRLAPCTTPGAGTGDYSLNGNRVNAPTTAHFNPTGAPSGAAIALQAAFSTWSSASSRAPSINVASDGTARSATADHMDELMFAPLAGRTLAITYTWHYGSTGEWEDDVVFNTKVPWFIASGYGTGCFAGIAAYDLQDVATHEFGHVYGLGHVQAKFNTMYPTATTGETYKRTLEVGDVNGIRAVYGG